MGCPPDQEERHKSGPVKLQECPGLSKTNSSLSLNVAGQRSPPHIWLNRAFPPSGSLVWTNRGSAWHCSAPAGDQGVLQASQTHQQSPTLLDNVDKLRGHMSQWFIQAPVRTSVAHQMFLKENNGTQVLFGDPLRKYTNVTLILPRDPPSQSLHLSSFVCSTHE